MGDSVASSDGVDVGCSVLNLLFLVGASVGACVGLLLGLKVGETDGLPVGAVVGASVGGGIGLGEGLGLDGEGLFDRFIVGYGVGIRVGRYDGFGRIDGLDDGLPEGMCDGLPEVGLTVGGLDTGFFVGGNVNASRWFECLRDRILIPILLLLT